MTGILAIKRLVLAASVSFLVLAGSARASDPVLLLTGQNPGDPLNVVLEQPMPPKIDAVTETPVVAEEPVQPEANRPGKIELAALYYYAGLKQDVRVEAEVRRLKAKFPGFVMPKDVFLSPAQRGMNEQPLWALYNVNDFAGIEAEIARMRERSPQWHPSEDFQAKLVRKKLRVGIEAAAASKDWATVIALGAGLDPTKEKEIDLLWTMIDAYAGTGNVTAAAQVYRSILFRTADKVGAPEIITTIQKATRDFKPEEIRAVMARFVTDPAVAAGLTSVKTDLLRMDVAQYNADETRKEPLGKEVIDPLVAAAKTSAKISDYSLLGWYYLKVENPIEAAIWFRKAIDVEASGEHAKGLYLALVRQDRQEEAFDLALKYKKDLESDPIFLMNALSERFANPDTGVITADAVKAYSATILATSNADHAEILAWYAYNSDQLEAAEAWFGKAIGWKPAEARVKGLALTYAALGDKPHLVKLYRKFAGDFPDIWDEIKLSHGRKVQKTAKMAKKQRLEFLDGEAEVEQVSLRRKAAVDEDMSEPVEKAPIRNAAKIAKPASGYLAHFAAKRYSECIVDLDGMQAGGGLSKDQSLIKGWCYLGLGRLAEARQAFSGSLGASGQVREDAAYGTALTFLRAKLTDDAESTISVYPLAKARDVEVRSEIYFQRARSAFDHAQYGAVLDALNARIAITPEPVNLSQMRGWAHFKLGHKAEARAIFERLNMHLDDPAIRRGLDATGDNTASASK